MTASPTSTVVAQPRTSRVPVARFKHASSSAAVIRADSAVHARSSSISAADQIAPAGFAIPSPAMSSAEPRTGSNRPGAPLRARSWRSPPFQARPGAQRPIGQNVSKQVRRDDDIDRSRQTYRPRRGAPSTRTPSTRTSGNSSPMRATVSSQNGNAYRDALDLVIWISTPPRTPASLNACRTIRSHPNLVTTVVSTATSWSSARWTLPPTPEYSPSCSRG